MSFRTNPDRILDHIDRQRNRDDDGRDNYARDATARELGTELPESDATPGERVRRDLRARREGLRGDGVKHRHPQACTTVSDGW